MVGTDAPLLPHQLKRIARRVPLGLARTGSIGHHGSGDIFLAFSTANREPGAGPVQTLQAIAMAAIDPLFGATVEATEEAIIDAMICNDTMAGRDGNTCIALPHAPLLDLFARAGRL